MLLERVWQCCTLRPYPRSSVFACYYVYGLSLRLPVEADPVRAAAPGGDGIESRSGSTMVASPPEKASNARGSASLTLISTGRSLAMAASMAAPKSLARSFLFAETVDDHKSTPGAMEAATRPAHLRAPTRRSRQALAAR